MIGLRPRERAARLRSHGRNSRSWLNARRLVSAWTAQCTSIGDHKVRGWWHVGSTRGPLNGAGTAAPKSSTVGLITDLQSLRKSFDHSSCTLRNPSGRLLKLATRWLT